MSDSHHDAPSTDPPSGWARPRLWFVLGASVLLALSLPLRRATPAWGVIGGLWLLSALLVLLALGRVVHASVPARRWAYGQDLLVVTLLLPAVARWDLWIATPHAFRVLIWGYGVPGLLALGGVLVRRIWGFRPAGDPPGGAVGRVP